jgi:hypothetical protein
MTQKDTERRASPVSPTMSLNDNMYFMGRELHIQTETVQSDTPCIRTHVFSHGRVIHTTKLEFPLGMKGYYDFDTIRDMMKMQHCQIMEKIYKKESENKNDSDF